MSSAPLPYRWNGRQEGDVVVLEAPDRWAPEVVRRGDELLLVVFVPDRHFDTVYEFPLTSAQVEVLRADDERYYFLFALLVRLWGDRRRHVGEGRLAGRVSYDRDSGRFVGYTPDELGAVYDAVLFGDVSEVEALLTHHDRESRGVVSHTIALHTGLDVAVLRTGAWFGVGITRGAADS